MKKGFGIAALALATGCAVIFAGCTGFNGCGNKGKSNEALFRSNWYAYTNYGYIQPTFLGEENAEVIKYSVTHDTKSAANNSYSVEYSEGTYTTKFYATTFDKTLIDNLIDEDFRGGYPENGITVYRYETTLDIPSVTFKIGDDKVEFKKENGEGNSVTTVNYFMDVNNHLRPLYSTQTIKAVSPAELRVNSLDDAYLKINQEVTTSYKYNGSAAKTVITDKDKDKTTTFTTGLGKTDNSVIDVSGLNIAVRAMQLSTSLSQVISVYSPSGKMQSYTFAGSSTALGEDERKTYEGILADGNLKLYTPEEGKSLKTVCVSCTFNNDMSGVSQKYWFAAIDNAKNNQGRATMVKMAAPIPFNHGTLNYKLSEITSTLYND